LAFKEDKLIFADLIAPVMCTSEVPTPSAAQPTGGPIDLDLKDVVPEPVAKTSKFSK